MTVVPWRLARLALALSVALGVAPWPTGLAVAATGSAGRSDVWRTPVVPNWRTGLDVAPPPAHLRSAAAVLMDPVSGNILYEHAAFIRRPPASTTKILTAYIVIRRGNLDRVVTVSRRAANTVGSRMHLRTGERLTVRALLTGLLMRSGNDAAQALAEATDGSTEAFAIDMNRVARSLGARGSHFENPHGLSDARHYTTAYDLARIARAAIMLPTFRTLVGTAEARVRDENGRVFDMHNTNRLLDVLAGADGVKTGTTNAAGKCLVSSATRAGFPLLAVVLDSPDRWGESAALLEWGFANFVPVQAAVGPGLGVAPASSSARGLAVALLHPLRAVVPRRLADAVRAEIWLSHAGAGRSVGGGAIGTARLEARGRTLANVAVVVAGRTSRLRSDHP